MPEMGKSIEEFIGSFTKKIQKGVLPPDPARSATEVLRLPATTEHASPLPPLIEKVHTNFTEPAVKDLPRLPMTNDFPVREWLKWKEE